MPVGWGEKPTYSLPQVFWGRGPCTNALTHVVEHDWLSDLVVECPLRDWEVAGLMPS